jgi:type II secretory pathway component GspD/PulD (secretin)
MTRVRKTKTTVRVEDGQTIFLAGLLSEETSVGVAKFPVLGDIPLLGRLFQHKTDKVSKKNLIIEITPKILWDSTSIEKQQSDASGGAIQTGPRAQPAPVKQTNEPETIEVAPAPAPAPAAPVDKKK